MLEKLIRRHYDKKFIEERRRRDESERKIIELSEKLEEHQKKLASIIEFQQEMVCRFDQDTKLTFVNDAYCRAFGYTEEELLNKSFIDFIPEDSRQLVLDNIKNLTSENPTNLIVHKIVLKDGSLRWHEWSDTVIVNSRLEIIEYQSVGRDITDRIKLENKLKCQQQLLDSVLEAQLDYVIRYDLDLKIIYANKVYCDLIRDGSECVGLYIDLSVIHNDDRQMFDDYLMKLQESPYRSEVEFRILVKGEYRWFHVTGVCLLNNRNEPCQIQSIGRDIHDKKILEKELTKQNKLLNSVLESATDLIVRTNLNFEITYANSAYQKTFFKDTENLIGTNFVTHHVHPEDFSIIRDNLKNLLEPPYRREFEWRSRNINDEYRWYHLEIVGILGDNGSSNKVVELQAICRDVTDQKNIANELLEKERFLENIVESIPAPVFYKGKDGCYQWFNKKFADFFGRDTKDLVGKTVFDVNPPDLAEIYYESDNNLLKKPGKHVYQSKFENSKGDVLDIVFYKATMVNSSNEIVGLVGVIMDITDRKFAEDQLRESEQNYRRLQKLFRNVVDIMPDMLWAKDLNKNYIFVNKSICKNLLNAKDINEPIGKNDMYFAERELGSHIDDPDWHTFGEICVNSDDIVLKTGKTGRFDEFGNVKGQFIYLDVIKTLLTDDNDVPIGIVGCARDITDRKELEDEIKYKSQLLDNILESQTDFIVRCDLDYYVTYCNNVYLKLFTRSRDCNDEKICVELFHPDDTPKLKDFLNSILEEPYQGTLDCQVKINTGEYRWFHINSVGILKDGKVVEIQSVGRDLTYKHQLYQKLNHQNQLLTGILEAQKDNIFRCDLERNIVFANKVFSNIFCGLSEISFCENTDFLEYVYLDDRDFVIDVLKNIFENSCKTTVDFRMVDFNENVHLYHWQIYCILDEKGKVYEIQFTGSDTIELLDWRKRVGEDTNS